MDPMGELLRKWGFSDDVIEHFASSTPNSKSKKVSFFRKLSRAKAATPSRSSTMQQQASVEMALRELNHPTHNEQLKNQQQVTFKLVKTVADFTTQLSQLYERHSSELQVLVASFRKRNSELRKERATCPSSLFHTWETLLQEVEADVLGYNNAAQSLERLVATPLMDRTFHMKVQARKLFAHREGCEVILGKADDQLNMSRQDYRGAFLNYCNNPTPATLATYYDSHNTYVQQLTATNSMLDQYHKHVLPTILQELEEILTDVTSAVSEAIWQEGEIITEKSNVQLRRYESLCAQARAVSSTADLAHLARTLLTAQPSMRPPKRNFLPPYPPEPDDPPLDVAAESMPPILKGEILLDRMGGQARVNYEQLRKDAQDLEIKIKQLQDTLDTLSRHQSRGIESNLYSKVNEIQDDISKNKYEYRATQLHLAAVRAQVHSQTNIKPAWIFEFKKMKPISVDKTNNKKNGHQSDDDNIRYKINTAYFNNIKSPKTMKTEKVDNVVNDDDDVRYKFPTVLLNRTKLSDHKPKPKQKIKVNFWSNKQSVSRLNNTDTTKQKTNRRHTVAATAEDINKPRNAVVKVRKRVSFLPSPIFSDNHIPMVTVPDDLTIQLNEEEANDLAEDLNLAFVNSGSTDTKTNNSKRKSKNSTDTSPREAKRKRSLEDSDTRSQGNENELEFFSKYVVQKLRRMETNQRIYSENLINTVLMLGQLGKLNGKSKIAEA